MTDLVSLLNESVKRYPDRPAVRLDEQVLTYGRLWDAAAGVAAGLRERGVRPGERVTLVLPNVPAFPVLFYGSLMAGCVVVPLNPQLKEQELAYCLADSGSSLVFAHVDADTEADTDAVRAARSLGVTAVTVADSFPVGARPFDPLTASRTWDDGDTAVILYTSGTTGRPKGAELTHRGMADNALITAQTLLETTETDVVMGCLPMFHVFGLSCGLNAALVSGACLTIVRRFAPDQVLRVIERDRVTVFEGVPTMYSALLHAAERDRHDVSSLRVCMSGGSAMPVPVLRAFEDAFGCVILEGYGLSETSGVASFNHPHVTRKPGSIGTSVRGVDLRLVDDDGADVGAGEIGEIAIRGETVMAGYRGRPDATKEAIPDGWFRSGDLATVDEEGFYTIVDRKKDLIIRAGFNVYPREVEDVLYTHPAVAEAAVVGIPDEHLGEEIGAAVALRPGATASPDELREFARQRIAGYKYPRRLWLVDALPKGPTGKILRRSVRPPTGA